MCCKRWHLFGGGKLIWGSRKDFQRTREILHFIHQASFVSALELVDSGSVSHMLSPSGRSVYQVIGSSGTPYTCFSTSNYCSCPAFTFSVLHKENHIMCKHRLAVKISDITGKTKVVNISDQQLADMLSSIEWLNRSFTQIGLVCRDRLKCTRCMIIH